jgi:Tannase and feruloyl esterase
MYRSICCAIGFLSLLMAALPAQTSRCAPLEKLNLAHTRLTSASDVPRGGFRIPQMGSLAARSVTLPSFCRVRGEVSPHIGFELWMPAGDWNGRFVAVGSGGFGGFMDYSELARILKLGYAVTANDTGHEGQTHDWMRNPAARLAWGHSATHDVVGPAKQIVRAYYSRPPAYSYFQGCSTGGAQAMEEAEFFPADFNGIVAASPGMNYSGLMLSFLWGLEAATDHAPLTPQKLQLLHRTVIEKCGSTDEIRNGYLNHPLACHFKPASLLCKGKETSQCLTEREVKTAEMIYQGPRNPRTGAQIYPGFVPGSEASREFTGPFAAEYGWSMIEGALAKQYAIPLLRNMVFGKDWDWKAFDWGRDATVVSERLRNQIDAINPDLRRFHFRGGKLIMIQGWGDPYNAQTYPINYRQQVVRLFASEEGNQRAQQTVDGFFRLFMAPGMGHCMGGPGPSRTDALAALRTWVENGQAPSHLTAWKVDPMLHAVTPSVSRPLCLWPKASRWIGKGAKNNASNYVCEMPKK